jgi:hypothetical protein
MGCFKVFAVTILMVSMNLSYAASSSNNLPSGLNSQSPSTPVATDDEIATIERSKEFQRWRASSSDSELVLPEVASMKPGPGGGTKDLLKRLMQGSKLIFRDVLEWRRLKDAEESTLPYEQARRLKETPSLALRIAPLVVNPLPPPFGLVLLCFANTMPRTLLTHHFYSDWQV